MSELFLLGCILAPFLLALWALGTAIEWYNAWKDEQQRKPALRQYPPPKRRETVYGDELDDFITREEDIA